ncbi:MAG TPA: DUF4349 domain-containing protein, partial [Candidatus Bathyarchaeia archaeon]|nr:DUF4349 domain-containing protein [Candidatus Bathyarchaeia archaeon]
MDWIRKNKLALFLIVILLFFLIRDYLPGFWFSRLGLEKRIGLEPAMETSIGGVGGADLLRTQSLLPVPFSKSAPVEQEERLVIEESSMSLVVENVREAGDKVVDKAKQVGGFMVSTSLTRPEEAPFATVVVRVPAEKFQEALDHFRGLSVKVSSENILGTDVTAEYVDLEARLA